jgi:hypothetical protein
VREALVSRMIIVVLVRKILIMHTVRIETGLDGLSLQDRGDEFTFINYLIMLKLSYMRRSSKCALVSLQDFALRNQKSLTILAKTPCNAMPKGRDRQLCCPPKFMQAVQVFTVHQFPVLWWYM